MTVEESDNAKQLARMLKVIADETRLRILGLLAERPLVGKELAERLDLTPPTVSHHMRKLVDAGIVTSTSDAQMQRYTLNSELLLDVRRTPVDSPAVDSTNPPESEEAAFRAKVMRTFFDGRKLRSIPARRKQRVVVLQHLLGWFAPGREYTEREVNDILRDAHDDVASLRRELVDYGYMNRERGIYTVARSTPPRSAVVAQEITGDERRWLREIVAAATRSVRSQ